MRDFADVDNRILDLLKPIVTIGPGCAAVTLVLPNCFSLPTV
jgi:hypothetical protein